jgi:hypothetical protein
MRKAYHNSRLILSEEGTFYGVSLGWDFCAEHEWGIEGISSKFGVSYNAPGVDGRTITRGKVFLAMNKKMVVLTSRSPHENATPESLLTHEMTLEDLDFETAWDGNDFCIASKSLSHFAHFRKLKEAFDSRDIVISFIQSKFPVFSNASLCILIKSLLPENIKEEIYKADRKTSDLEEYEKAIGMDVLKRERKGNYGEIRYFLACSPSWIDYENLKNREEKKFEWNTQYDILYWVNYSDDDDNYGWYTVEEIMRWLKDDKIKLSEIRKSPR